MLHPKDDPHIDPRIFKLPEKGDPLYEILMKQRGMSEAEVDEQLDDIRVLLEKPMFAKSITMLQSVLMELRLSHAWIQSTLGYFNEHIIPLLEERVKQGQEIPTNFIVQMMSSFLGLMEMSPITSDLFKFDKKLYNAMQEKTVENAQSVLDEFLKTMKEGGSHGESEL